MKIPASGRRGSSPHARGGLTASSTAFARARLIPACAGRASPRTPRGSWPRAHPRMRGEGPDEHCTEEGLAGSSPHARGGRQAPRWRLLLDRLIPACAGRAATYFASGSVQAAHPRMRGEGADQYSAPSSRVGSSPHARGGLVIGPDVEHAHRLIPACAGRAAFVPTRFRGPGAHPRMRGEGLRKGWGRAGGYGSSPHARGGPGARAARGCAAGLIPACAGRAPRDLQRDQGVPAHPRMRGEGRVAPCL